MPHNAAAIGNPSSEIMINAARQSPIAAPFRSVGLPSSRNSAASASTTCHP
jgi:hypothetical protein